MTGWIKSGEHPVAFGINVPPSNEDSLTNAVVEFSVTPVLMSGQRGPFQKNQLIGLKRSHEAVAHWYPAHPGEEYEIIGIYIGGGMVLAANVPGGA